MTHASVGEERDLTGGARPRRNGIDAVRYLSLFMVGFIHAPQLNLASMIADSAARFAVPFFFIATGFFLPAPDRTSGSSALRQAWRIAAPFLAWSLIYLLASRTPLSSLLDPARAFNIIVLGKAALHLWFMPALLIAVLLVRAARAHLTPPALMAIAAAIYVAGLLIGPYGVLIHSPGLTFFNENRALFFAFPLVSLGYCLARWGWRVPLWAAILIFAVGGVMQAAEYHLLHRFDAFVVADQFFGTPAFGLGAFLLALRLRDAPWVSLAAAAGRYSLGIYCMHLLVLHVAVRLLGHGHFLTDVLEVALTLAFCTGAAIILGKVPVVRSLVR